MKKLLLISILLTSCASSKTANKPVMNVEDRLALEKDVVVALCEKASSTGKLAQASAEVRDFCRAFGVE